MVLDIFTDENISIYLAFRVAVGRISLYRATFLSFLSLIKVNYLFLFEVVVQSVDKRI